MQTVSLFIHDQRPDEIEHLAKRSRFCENLKRGFEGCRFSFATDRVGCPLGRYNLGVGPGDERQKGKLAKALVRWEDAATADVARVYLDGLAPAQLAGKWIEVRPGDTWPGADLVVARGTPAEIMALVHEFVFRTGRPLDFHVGGIGASCGEIVAGTLTKGQPALSLGCRGTRRHGGLSEHELMLAAPPNAYAIMTKQPAERRSGETKERFQHGSGSSPSDGDRGASG